GVLMQGLASRGRGGLAAAILGTSGLAILMTIDAARWYHRFGWIDDRGRPVRSVPHDPVLDWVEAHGEVDSFLGGYWDVYRVSFLSTRRVRGIPYPVYPDRFPEWASSSTNGHPGIVAARPSPEGNLFVSRALKDGGRVLHRARGVIVVTWP
ncbi:ArnT family glycosyltransferase, partial [Singulisphaera rosea]